MPDGSHDNMFSKDSPCAAGTAGRRVCPGTGPAAPDSPAGKFHRELGLFDAVMLVAGSMVGSGIFIVSADIARTVGGPALLLAVWLISGVMTVCGALSFAELAAMMPDTGGQYVFLRKIYGRLAGFLYGWTFFLVIQTGIIAAVAVAFAKFCAVFAPALALKTGMVSGESAVAVASILLITFINTRGLSPGKAVQDSFTLAKIAALAAVIFFGFSIGKNPQAVAANLSAFWSSGWTFFSGGNIAGFRELTGLLLWQAVAVALVGALFSSDAWNGITFVSAEVKNPERNIPLGLLSGTALVTTLYLLVNAAYLAMLPLAGDPGEQNVFARGIQFAASDRVATAAIFQTLGGAGAAVMAGLIMVSTFGCNNGMVLSGARVLYAMGRDGLFFAKAGKLNSRGVPAWALWAQGLWAAFLCLTGTYGDLLDYVIATSLVFHALTVTGVFVMRWREPSAARPYKTWGYPLTPALYVASALFVSASLFQFKPKYTWPGLLIVLAGAPVYYLRRHWSQKTPPGSQN